jgi:hypothetical protein
MLSKLRRLAALSPVEGALCPPLTLFSLSLRVALSIASLPRITSLLSRTASFLPLDRISLCHPHRDIDRFIALSDLATSISHGHRRCLPRALLLFWFVCAKRQPVSLCLRGHTHHATWQGHAWVEQDGAVLGDTLSFIDRDTFILRLPA